MSSTFPSARQLNIMATAFEDFYNSRHQQMLKAIASGSQPYIQSSATLPYSNSALPCTDVINKLSARTRSVQLNIMATAFEEFYNSHQQ